MSIYPLLSGVPTLEANVVYEAGFWSLDDEASCKVRDLGLDILVQAAFPDRVPLACSASRYGIWYYRHSDQHDSPGTPAGFWEVVNECPETCSSLRAADGHRRLPPVLYRCSFFTHPLSPVRNRSYFLWAASSFLGRQIRKLCEDGEAAFVREIAPYNQASPGRDICSRGMPSNSEMFRLLPTIGARFVDYTVHRLLYRDQWFLLYSLSKDAKLSFRDYRAIKPARDRFWADPIVIQEDGKYYIFLEELLYKTNKGHISVMEMDGTGSWKAPVPILQADCHLSYPFVFRSGGEFYMIPESAEKRTVDLYKCTAFPYEWHFVSSLMKDTIAVDTTLIFVSGKWWMFSAIAEHEGAHPQVQLFLFFAKDLLDDKWVSHPRNPVVTGIRNTRPAGKMFMREGKLYRPAQICAGGYGKGFNINEVEILTETDYREKVVDRVLPDWDDRIVGTHTYAREGDLVVIDALARRPAIF